MNRLVLPLASVGLADTNSVGRKAAALGRLLEAGFPVPAGLCLTTAAFRRAVAGFREAVGRALGGYDLRSPGQAAKASAEIDEVLVDLTMPLPVTQALRETLPAILGDGVPLAVRSSSTFEDQDESSFAGHYVSVLAVQDEAELYEAILTCWRSSFSPQALAAQAAIGRSAEAPAMAVLIQPVIDAECAGVCYSIDPVRRDRQRFVVISTWGLGAGLADGSMTGDTYRLRRSRFDLERRHIVEKTEEVSLGANGNLERRPVAVERRRAACLPQPWLERVAQFGLAAELLFGRPQDVEWAIEEEQLWLLQSRPITRLPPQLAKSPPFPIKWSNEHEPRCFWKPYPLTGRAGDVLLPLELDYLAAVESIREEACRFMGADKNGKLGFFNGRAYFCALPIDLAPADRRVRQAALADLQDRLHEQGLTAWDYWGPEVVKAVGRLQAFEATMADGPALAEHLEEALAVRRRHAILHPLMWFKPDDRFFEAFAAVSGLSGSAAEEAAYRLLKGEETILTRLIDDLYGLGETARESPVLAALVADSPADILEGLASVPVDEQPSAAAFRSQLEDFLAEYGDRNGAGYGSEATIGTPTWRERPDQILRLVARYLDPAVEPPAPCTKASPARARRIRREPLSTVR